MSQSLQLETMREVFGNNDTVRSIAWVFKAMDLAEVEIGRAKMRHPGSEARHRLDATFLALTPPEAMRVKAEEVYRSHCRELLGRAVRGESLDPGTDAECLCAIMEVSLRTPVRTDFAVVADQVFRSVMGRLSDEVPRLYFAETYDGAAAEVLAEVRHKVRVEGRGKQ